MEYMMLIYESPHERSARNDPQRAEAYHASWTAYVQALAQSGIMKSGNGLQLPETGTTVACAMASGTCRTGPTPTARSNWAVTSSWTRRISTWRWTGRRAARPHRMDRSRSGR